MAGPNTFGGQMRFTLSDGRRISMRGKFEIEDAGIKVESEKNLDRSAARIVTLKNYKMDVDLELPRGVTSEALLAFKGNATVIEDHTGVMHLFSSGFFTGDAKTDRMKGVTSGLAFEAVGYRQVTK